MFDSVKTDVVAGGAVSRLFIANARTVDSGNYTCALADLAEATVAVHVLNGESTCSSYHVQLALTHKNVNTVLYIYC